MSIEIVKDNKVAKTTSKIVAGLMRISKMSQKEVDELVLGSVELGVNFFDLADIYGRGKCEELFGNTLATHKGLREKVIIQTKCGITAGTYDFSYEHIMESVEGSLKRLKTNYIDVLLLHRPDALVIPEEVAKAFNELESSKKVRYFGVSNQNPYQIELLKRAVKQPLLFNQLQFGPAFTGLVDSGINVNNHNDKAISRDGHVYEYSRLNDMVIQAWSPYQYGFFEGVIIGSDKYKTLNEVLDKLALKYKVTSTSIVAAFVLKLPDFTQIVTGTTKVSRMKEIVSALSYTLTHDEWYEIYLAAGNLLP
jgi:predicted oxidoreductase